MRAAFARLLRRIADRADPGTENPGEIICFDGHLVYTGNTTPTVRREPEIARTTYVRRR